LSGTLLCSPALTIGSPGIAEPADLARHGLLHAIRAETDAARAFRAWLKKEASDEVVARP
jgi:hypothetical protein